MNQVIRSFNGEGRLILRGGGSLAGRYHIDVSYLAVRRLTEAQGAFELIDPPNWDSVVDSEFAGAARIALDDGREIAVTLGGITGTSVSIVAMDTIRDAEPG